MPRSKTFRSWKCWAWGTNPRWRDCSKVWKSWGCRDWSRRLGRTVPIDSSPKRCPAGCRWSCRLPFARRREHSTKGCSLPRSHPKCRRSPRRKPSPKLPLPRLHREWGSKLTSFPPWPAKHCRAWNFRYCLQLLCIRRGARPDWKRWKARANTRSSPSSRSEHRSSRHLYSLYRRCRAWRPRDCCNNCCRIPSLRHLRGFGCPGFWWPNPEWPGCPP